jgi:hypothetical protein
VKDSRLAREKLAGFEAQADLVDRLVDLVDRTFSAGDHGAGLRTVRTMLERISLPELEGLLAELGIEAPEEMTERDDERSRRGAS